MSAANERHVFRLPDLGEGLTEAEILRWLVTPGDDVEVNQPLVEVETAKAAVEVPSPVAGTVAELGAVEGQLLAVGAPLVVLAVRDEVDGATSARAAVLVGYGPREAGPIRRRRRTPPGVAAPPSAVPSSAGAPAASLQLNSPPVVAPVPEQVGPERVLAKPPVRKLARDLGLDLRNVPGTGPAGIVTRADVEEFRRRTAPDRTAGEERIPVRSLRRATAEAMLRSLAVPQASVDLTVDVTPVLRLRDRLAETDRPKPSFLALVARAVLLALAERPLLHARWEERPDLAGGGSVAEIVVPSSVSLGIAVASARGLLVPKIHDAQAKSLAALGAEIDRLATSAREGRLTAQELTGGTFTLSNLGVFAVDGGTSLLSPGETGILCIGAIRERPWVENGALVVRQVVALTLTIDHRVVDGEVAARFLADVGALLHDPGQMLARS